MVDTTTINSDLTKRQLLFGISQQWFAVLITLVYGGFLAFTMAHHELWRDETQAWMISAASNSVSDIFRNIRYEGHPPLWFLVIWPFTYFENPDWIKVPHFLLSITTVFLVLRYAPFPRLVSVMLVFSYFFFYEYGVISRNYQLGVLGIIGFLVFLPKALKKPWVAVGFLAMAASANVYSLIVSMVLGLYYLVQVFPKLRNITTPTDFKWHLTAGALVLIGLIVATGVIINPPANQDFSPKWHWSYNGVRAQEVVSLFAKVFIPTPKDHLSFWNKSFMDEAWIGYVAAALAGILALALHKYPRYLGWFLLMLVALLAFHYIKYVGHLRHGGHMWLMFTAIVWLLASHVGWRELYKPLKAVFLMLLVGQLYASVVAVAKEMAYPFSGGKAAAQFVKQEGYTDYHIIGHLDNGVSAFVAYHGSPIYFTIIRGMGTFVEWSDVRKYTDFGLYLQQEEMALRQGAAHTIIVTNENLGPNFDWLELVFDSGRNISEERIRIFAIKPLP